MTDLTKFRQYKEIADQLIEIADKEQLAECARLLALNVAHYEMQYGALPLDETLATTSSGKPNDQQAELVAKGMRPKYNLVNDDDVFFGEDGVFMNITSLRINVLAFSAKIIRHSTPDYPSHLVSSFTLGIRRNQ